MTPSGSELGALRLLAQCHRVPLFFTAQSVGTVWVVKNFSGSMDLIHGLFTKARHWDPPQTILRNASPSLCNFLQSSALSILLSPNVAHSTLLSNNPNLCSPH